MSFDMSLDMTSSERLRALVPSLAGRCVLVVGDVMLDRFISGEVLRISPESPVPVLSVRQDRMMPGGAGNVLANLAGLGVTPRIVALTGRDAAAEDLKNLLAGMGCDVSGLLDADDRPTTLKTRFVASGQHLLRVDAEDAKPATDTLEQSVIDRALAQMDGADAVILSDYGKGVLTPRVLRAVIDAALARKIPVLVDPKGSDYTVYRGASVVTPNRKELAQATGNMPVQSDDDIVAAGRVLLERCGLGAVVATRSEDGMSVLQEGAAPLHLRASAREVFDVSGAGDTVIATVAAGLAAGLTLADAAALSNRAAGIVVGKIGTAPIQRDELLAVLPDAAPHATGTENWGEAAGIVGQWKKLGLKVGFTNGCFDILHAGHVSYLQAARSRCDRLVVGLNSDESVRRLKGENRPVNDEDSRIRVLSALSCVDMVVIFGRDAAEADTPLQVLHALTPDLLVKGADYTVETVVGADYVISKGGEVWLAPLEDGKSTTNTIKKMQGVA